MELLTRSSLPTSPLPLRVPSSPQAQAGQISTQYVDAFESALQEPDHLRGVVYCQSADGAVKWLKYSGETTDTLPADVPETAVKNGRVVLYVDGIHQEISEQHRQINSFLHGHASTGTEVGQDVVAIHEGAGKSGFRDGLRIAKVLAMLKLVQTGVVPLQWATKKLYAIDPAIKSVHDEVKQSLLAGRKVQLMTHSGGGAETATALTLLKKEGMGAQIRDNVRLLSCSSAASLKDFEGAGLKSENIYYTGSKKDPVHYLFRHYIHPLAPVSTLAFGIDVVRYLAGQLYKDDPNGLAFHAPDYIFAKNMDDQGQRMQKFLNGGPGGNFDLP